MAHQVNLSQRIHKGCEVVIDGETYVTPTRTTLWEALRACLREKHGIVPSSPVGQVVSPVHCNGRKFIFQMRRRELKEELKGLAAK